MNDLSESSYLGNEVDLRIVTDHFVFCLLENIKNREGNEVWLAFDEKQLDALKNKSSFKKAQLIERCQYIIKFSADLPEHLAQLSNEHTVLELLLHRGNYRFLPKLYCAADAEVCYQEYQNALTDEWEKEPIPNKAFIAFPYIPSQNLFQQSKSWLQTERVNNTFALMAAFKTTFAELSTTDIVHRDISPNNLLIDNFNGIHIIDFAFSVDLKTLNSNNSSKTKLIGEGTAKYRSPEVMTQSHVIDTRADQFSLACVFYFLITGKAAKNSPGDALIAEFEQNLPEELIEPLVKAIAYKADERFDSHHDFLTALEQGFLQYQQALSGVLPIKICSDLWLNHKNRLKEIEVELQHITAPLTEQYSILTHLSNAHLLKPNDIALFASVEKTQIEIANYMAKLKIDIKAAEKQVNQLELAIVKVKTGNALQAPQISLTEPQPIKRSEYTAFKSQAQQQATQIPALLDSAKSFINKELEKHIQWPNTELSNALNNLQQSIDALTKLEKELNQKQGNSEQAALVNQLSEHITLLNQCCLNDGIDKHNQSYQKALTNQKIITDSLSYKLTSPEHSLAVIKQVNELISNVQKLNMAVKQSMQTLTMQQQSEQITADYWQQQWKKKVSSYKWKIFFFMLLCMVSIYGFWQPNPQTKTVNQLPKVDQVFSVGGVNFTMKYIPAGSFEMGCVSSKNCYKDQLPVHEVTLEAFSMMETEVTWALYQQCIYELFSCLDINKLIGSYEWSQNDLPVTDVSYYDIHEAFIPWLNKKTGLSFSLPSEAQWEYASRAGTSTKYNWGDEIDCTRAHYNGGPNSSCYRGYGSRVETGPAPVKSYSANKFGLYDMHGNLTEWTQDNAAASYQNAPLDGSSWLEGKGIYKTTRGGSWYNKPLEITSAYRGGYRPGARSGSIGFRLVLSPKNPKNQSKYWHYLFR